MKLKTNQKGFTIVELLIVVVVIAILAAISIVAYTGITNRANRSAAMEAANSVRSVATTYQGVNSEWPRNKYDFTRGGGDPIAKLPTGIVFSCTDPLASDAPDVLRVTPRINSSSDIIGYTITYWDYAPTDGGAVGTRSIQVGDTTSGTNRASVSNDATQSAVPCS